MAGETQQVATVMHKLMHVHAFEHGRRALLGADEVNREQQQQAAEDRPGQDFAQGNGRYLNVGASCSCIIHENLLG